ncbi:MAG: hypothetical protein ACYC1U_06800 [Candidatus Aquicultorales bacterium]
MSDLGRMFGPAYKEAKKKLLREPELRLEFERRLDELQGDKPKPEITGIMTGRLSNPTETEGVERTEVDRLMAWLNAIAHTKKIISESYQGDLKLYVVERRQTLVGEVGVWDLIAAETNYSVRRCQYIFEDAVVLLTTIAVEWGLARGPGSPETQRFLSQKPC